MKLRKGFKFILPLRSYSQGSGKKKHVREEGHGRLCQVSREEGAGGVQIRCPPGRGGGTAALAGRMQPLEEKSRTLPLISSFHLQGELVLLLFLFYLFFSADQCCCWDYTG